MLDGGFWIEKDNKPQMYKCWMMDDGRMMLDSGFWIEKDNKPQMYKCWMMDGGFWIEKDNKPQMYKCWIEKINQTTPLLSSRGAQQRRYLLGNLDVRGLMMTVRLLEEGDCRIPLRSIRKDRFQGFGIGLLYKFWNYSKRKDLNGID